MNFLPVDFTLSDKLMRIHVDNMLIENIPN